jgi:hypothetical protein
MEAAFQRPHNRYRPNVDVKENTIERLKTARSAEHRYYKAQFHKPKLP